MQLFVDLDGVLADFDLHYFNMFGIKPDRVADNVDWELVRNAQNFYLGIPPMSDMDVLWSAVKTMVPEPVVLTGIPSSIPEAAQNKRDWVARNLGTSVPVVTCFSKDKCLQASPGDVLIDDWIKYRHLWTARGGLWITHTSAEDTIRQLREVKAS